jgi:hypothetical protein
MKVGDLVRVNNKDGTVFGRGILVENSDSALIRLLSVPSSYVAIWMFLFESSTVSKEKTMLFKETSVFKITTFEDW